MLCNDCRNKKICKYYSMLNNGPLVVEIKSCEAMNPIQQQNPVQNVTRPLKFKQPIDYSILDQKQEPADQSNDDEERIVIDLSEAEDSKVLSFTDILLGGDDNGSTKK